MEVKEIHEKRPKKYYLAGIVPIVFLALGILSFFLTEDLREKQAKEKEKSLYQEVLPEAESFETVKIDSKAAAEVLSAAGFSDVALERVLEGKSKAQQNVGRIYELSTESGYGGNLTLLVGMNESKVLCGIRMKKAPEMVEVLTKEELDAFLEQFLYSRKDKTFWVDERVFGGLEIIKMESAPVTSRKIVSMVNGCRQLSDRMDTLVKGEGE